MRRSLVGAVTSVLAAATALVAVQFTVAPSTPAAAAAAEPYSWKNVRIDGGGFVPGIVFNPTEKNLVYARTDIGGAYRWEQATQSWTPLLDWVGVDKWGWNGVASIATDPVQTNRVYAAVGMYTNGWDPNKGAVLRSADKGATWQVSELPFHLGGNMPGRGMGERLAVDPNRNGIVYLGAPGGNGLWRSTDHGATWARVTAFPNAGNYPAADANNQGVVWVSFDESTGTAGAATRTIYVGVADKQHPVYRSTDAGVTWEPVPGAPTGYLPHKGVVDHEGGFLYIATSDTGGPYDGGKGDVWRFSRATGQWTRISPVPSTDSGNTFGYSGLTVDRQDPDTVMVASQVAWWPDTQFWRSTDRGATWTRIWDWTNYPNRSFRYTMDASSVPWLTFGNDNPAPPDTSPKLGWMNESVEIDPHDSDRMMYGTGATIYGTTDLTKWDTGDKFTIRPMVKGLEETAILDLISPPSGAPLHSAIGDIAGFRHDDLDVVPGWTYRGPNWSPHDLDYAETKPAVIVRAGSFKDADRPGDSHVAFSTDGGVTWFQGGEPAGITNGGMVAAAADGSRFVWAPGDSGAAVLHSVGHGTSWTASTGIPANARVASDRVNPNKFYGLSNGKVYVSTNGGAGFTASAAAGLPATGRLKAVPGREGELWLAGSGGLWRSSDSGASFTKLSTVTTSGNIGFGKAAPGQTYPALYLFGTVDGKHGVYRSDNAGAAWVRINDDQHQYGNAGDALTGDPRVYGRVYLGTNGRGILVADRLGGTPSPTPTTPAPTPTSPSPSPTSPSPSPTGSAPTTPVPAGGCTATYKVTGSWQGGFQAEVSVRNNGGSSTSAWSVVWNYTAGQKVTQLWGGSVTQTGTQVVVRNADWNGALGVGASTSFGFIGSWTGTNPVPTLTCTAVPAR
ncbi:cellulose binding domain-containing protein [Micromonospora citrea]|uniref:cellulose binding domain-containing protein n=1 Tax=Micromonospora citrea TaxID=47855 RepID=UPI003C389AB5